MDEVNSGNGCVDRVGSAKSDVAVVGFVGFVMVCDRYIEMIGFGFFYLNFVMYVYCFYCYIVLFFYVVILGILAVLVFAFFSW